MTRILQNPITQNLRFRTWFVCLLFSSLINQNLIFSDTAYSGNGGRIGTGGDWIRTSLNQAKREAANWANTVSMNLTFLDSDSSIPKDTVAYKLLKQPNALRQIASDIMSSPHDFIDKESSEARNYTTCAWTNDPSVESLDLIVFSPHLCEGGLLNGGQNFANKTMIHESVHHILRDANLRAKVGANFKGTQDQQRDQEEKVCDELALNVQKVFEAVVLSGKPHWRDIQSPVFQDGDKYEMLEPRGFHVTAWTGATNRAETKNKMLIWGGCHEGAQTIYACGNDQYFNDGALYDPEANTWKKINSLNAPSPRAAPGSAWTGENLFIWGGCVQGDGCEKRLGDGASYNPANNQWTPIAKDTNTPEPRVNHAMIWAPDSNAGKLIIWGGYPQTSHGPNATQPIKTGGVYDIKTKTWTPMDAKDPLTPKERGFPTAIWTGDTHNPLSANKMFIWGGCNIEIADACNSSFADSAFFDPTTMKWSKVPTKSPMQPKARHNHSALYRADQSELYIFGGFDADGNVITDGWIFNLRTLQWKPMPSMSEGRFKHQAVWAGDRMLIFGGKIYNKSTRTFELANSVISYIPSATDQGRWITYKTDEMTPLQTIEHSTVWTGFSMIAWGGQIFDRGFTNTGSQFFPGLNLP